jgi:hypothetical protein
LQSDLIESGFNPRTLSRSLSGAERTRLPLNALTSNQKSNCNVRLAPLSCNWILITEVHRNVVVNSVCHQLRRSTSRSDQEAPIVRTIAAQQS